MDGITGKTRDKYETPIKRKFILDIYDSKASLQMSVKERKLVNDKIKIGKTLEDFSRRKIESIPLTPNPQIIQGFQPKLMTQ